MRPLLVTGSSGQIGWELRRSLSTFGELLAPSRRELDLSRPDTVAAYVRKIRPAVVINPAAYTAVDKAEAEPDEAQRVNAESVQALAEVCAELDCLLVHYSTDYVFDGRKTTPYLETDEPNPDSVYGRSKLAGERAIQAVGGRHLIVRTSWVYGARGKNFLLTMLRLAREREQLRVVADQFGAPTWCRTIADATAQMLRAFPLHDAPPAALVHLSSAGRTTWHEFAARIVSEGSRRGLTRDVSVLPITTSDYPTAAPRPAQSALCCDLLESAFGVVMPRWEDSLALCLDDIAALAPGWHGPT